jgi:hypothetical protein
MTANYSESSRVGSDSAAGVWACAPAGAVAARVLDSVPAGAVAHAASSAAHSTVHRGLGLMCM